MTTGGTETIAVKILGQTYRLQAGDDPDHVKRVAEFVNSKLEEISKAAPDYSTQQLAILAALNVADEYMKISGGTPQEGEEFIKEKVHSLLEKVSSIEIDPDLLDPEEIEMLQDMLVASVNSAIEQSQALAAQKMEGLTGGSNINDLLGGLG